MKIDELLNESSDQYSDGKLFEMILNSKFYNINKDELDEDYALFRGMRSIADQNNIHTFKYRKGPLDTGHLIHEITNEMSQEEFGLPIRNLIFGTTDREVASNYGKVYVLFPLGDYELYYHSDIADFTNVVANEDHIDSAVFEQNDSHFEESMKDFFDENIKSLEEIDGEAIKKWFYEEEHIYDIKNFINETHFSLYSTKDELVEKVKKIYEDFVKQVMHYGGDNKEDISLVIKDVFRYGLSLLFDYIEEHVRSYLVDVNESQELRDTGMGDDAKEIMVYCEQYIMIDIQKYSDFLEDYHNV